jgi:hypothetical protein
MPGRPHKFTSGGAVYNDDVTIANVTGGAASGTTPWISSSDWAALRLNCRGVSYTGGTAPAVTVTVQQASDASGTNLATLGTFPALTAGQSARLLLGPVDRFVRCSWTTTGTPTATNFTVDGEGV